jgi:hypothetical protein
LKNPYGAYYIIELMERQLVIITQAITVKEKGADNTLHEIIGKGHLPHIR